MTTKTAITSTIVDRAIGLLGIVVSWSSLSSIADQIRYPYGCNIYTASTLVRCDIFIFGPLFFSVIVLDKLKDFQKCISKTNH